MHPPRGGSLTVTDRLHQLSVCICRVHLHVRCVRPPLTCHTMSPRLTPWQDSMKPSEYHTVLLLVLPATRQTRAVLSALLFRESSAFDVEADQ